MDPLASGGRPAGSNTCTTSLRVSPGPAHERPGHRSLVCGLLQFAVPVVMTVLALVFGYVARNQIRERGESGEGMAKAGIILGWVGVALGVLGLLFFVAAFSALDGRGF
jgi:hypothetical protein